MASKKTKDKTRAPYEDAEIRAKLIEIRDRTIDWWVDVTAKRGKTGAASFNYEKVINELSRLDAVASKFDANQGSITIKWGADSQDTE
jgi:hypothetical protein